MFGGVSKIFKGNNKVKLTPEGGLAIKLTNKTGGASIKGYICEPASVQDYAIKYTTDGDIDPIGIIYEDGVPDGKEVWVVVAGIAEVYYGTTVTRGTFSRVAVIDDSLVTGQAVNEALPVPPFATNKHFQEIGHPIESRGTPGLAKTILHFN